MNRKGGRPCNPYRSSSGLDVPGLIRIGDGRWRIRKLHLTFTEPDEFKAVQRATGLLGLGGSPLFVDLPVAGADPLDPVSFQNAKKNVGCGTVVEDPDNAGMLRILQSVPEAALWR